MMDKDPQKEITFGLCTGYLSTKHKNRLVTENKTKWGMWQNPSNCYMVSNIKGPAVSQMYILHS